MNNNEITFTSIQCRLLLSMYMDSTRYTIMYNNTGMYHEPRHELEKLQNINKSKYM